VVYEFLMAEKTGQWFYVAGGFPEIHCEVVGSGDEFFYYTVANCSGFFVAFSGDSFFVGDCEWDFPCMIEEAGAEDMVCGEGEVVYPVGVGF